MSECPPREPRENPAMFGARRKGFEAALSGCARSENPYPDYRTPVHNHTTWSRAFRRAWDDGFTQGELAEKRGCAGGGSPAPAKRAGGAA